MTEIKTPQTMDSFQNEATDDEHLFRVVNREGDWTHYYQDEIKRYMPAVNHVLAIGFPKGQGLIQWLKRMDEKEAERVLETAGERGAKIHAAIRMLIMGKTLTMNDLLPDDENVPAQLSFDEWDAVLSWVKWAELFKPKVLTYESAVWNRKHLYAGTTDFTGTIELPAGTKLYLNDKLVTIKETKTISALLDWKSGGTYDDHKLQIAAYAGCLKTKPKGEFYTGIVRIGTKHTAGFEIKLWDRERTKFHFARFLEARNQYGFITGKEGWEPDIIKIPITLSASVPQIGEKKGKNVRKTQPRKSDKLRSGNGGDVHTASEPSKKA